MIKLSEYYEGFFNNSMDAIIVLNDEKFIHVNQAAVDMFGYSKEELKELSPGRVSPKFQPDGQNSIEKSEWMILLSLKNGSNKFEWLHKRKDGSEFWCEVLLTPVIEKKINVYAIIRDISKRKVNGERIRKLKEEKSFLLKNTDVFLYRYNLEGLVQYVSSSVKEITGYERYEWKNSYLTYLTDSFMNNDVDEKIASVLEDKKSISFNIEIYNKAGKRRVLNITESPSFDSEKNLIGIIGRARDISSDLEIEESILYAQKMDVLSELLSGFTLDVNNSITVLKGNVEVVRNKLIESELFDELEDRFSFVDKSVKRILNMLDKLLLLSKKYDNKKKVIDLNDFIFSITEDLKKVFNRNINIEVKLLEEESLVYVSHYNLHNILTTILVNSYNLINSLTKSRAENKTDIKILLKKFLINDADFLEIEIFDDYNGRIEKIINIDSITRSITKDKGSIKLPSIEKKSLSLLFPVYSKELKDDSLDILNYKSNGETILIIDDELLVIKTASEILKNFGFNVIFALNGKDGLTLYKQNIEEIDLTIIDMHMPEMDGEELFYKLKDINSDMKIILSSGYRNDDKVLNLISCNKISFIPKPYSMKLFIEEVVRGLKK